MGRRVTFESNQSGIETPSHLTKIDNAQRRLNRTRVELKLQISTKYTHIGTVWIEPEWNWNHMGKSKTTNRSSRLNRTRVELKPVVNSMRNVMHEAFESNQSGIETVALNDVRCPAIWFESNQSGIETIPFNRKIGFECGLNRTRVELKLQTSTKYTHIGTVWIEPEWNWNGSAISITILSAKSLNRTRVELKLFISKSCSDSDLGLNRTRVELKHPGSSIIRGMDWAVWIEPEWNWNRPTQRTKADRDEVWIEPEWNWNHRLPATMRDCCGVWIEPEWNWNLARGDGRMGWGQFESNQSGIETALGWRLSVRFFHSLNRTRVELKRHLACEEIFAQVSLNRTRVELKRLFLV